MDASGLALTQTAMYEEVNMKGEEILRRLSDAFLLHYPRVRELSDQKLPSRIAQRARPFVNLWKLAASVQVQVLFNARGSLEAGLAFDDPDPEINADNARSYGEAVGNHVPELALAPRPGRKASNFYLTREFPVSTGQEDYAIENVLSS